MEKTHDSTPKFWQPIIHPSLVQREAEREGHPFFLVTTILLVSVAVLLFPAFSARFTVWHWAAFIFLLPTHIALHWISARFFHDKRLRIAYLAAQGVLALALIWLTASPEMTLALFASLIAETIGLLGVTRLTAVAVIGYLLLTVLSFLMLGGTTLLQEWDSPLISTFALLIIFMVLYRRQTDAREQTQALLAELETTHRQLADYAAQVEDLTLAAERQRMARELHDTLAQGVAGLVLQLEAANNHLENGRIPRAQTIVQQSMKRARSTLADARAAIDDLRLEDRILSEAVRRHTDRFTQATGIPCHLALELGAETAVPPTIADHAERIISESLTNITRHAQADNVWLNVTQSTEQLRIEVRDDGVGFDVATAVRAEHYGLLGMRERARLVSGTFEITSQAQEGTSLHISLPLEAT